MTFVVSSFGALCKELGQRRLPSGALVGIEGHSKAGKSELAVRLSVQVTRAIQVHTDCYASDRGDDDEQGYVDCLNLPLFRRDLERAWRHADIVLVEGICLRDTLATLGVEAGLFIYCKRMTEAGLWAHMPMAFEGSDEASLELSWVDDQSVQYHKRTDPLSQADIVYEWREFDPFSDP